MGDYGKAEPFFLEARALYEKALGTEHPEYATALNNLGSLYQAMGDYGKAEPCFLESRAIREKALGKEHPDYGYSLSNLSYLYLSTGAYSKSETFRKEQVALTVNLINRNFAFMPERQREAYWNMVKKTFDGSYSLSQVQPVPSVNALNYNNTLFAKGLLLRTSSAVRDAIYASGDARLIERFETLGSLHRQITQLQQNESADKASLKRLETQAEDLEKALTRSSAAFREAQADMALQWQDVRQSLKPDEAALEFISFSFYDKAWTDKTRYAALVLRPGMNAPVWIPLCEETQIQEILKRAEGRSADQQARIIYDVSGAQLYGVVWKPLEASLAGVKTVYYSPSGLLHKVAFNALPAEGSRLADKYDLNLVSSTREVVHARKQTAPGLPAAAAVYGGLEYNTPLAQMQTLARTYRSGGSAPVFSGSGQLASALPADRTRGGGSWVELPATRQEARNIQGYLTGRRIENTLYQDSFGSEESFKALDGKKVALIHVATHGFFLADLPQSREARDFDQPSRGGFRAAAAVAANPLLRSGLVLSGGNHAWTGEPVEGVEDGILTADEIARLNLLGARLVVLSACQTGLGDVNNSEGVFGLQRAFKLAGVETLIMSLWEVDDAATAKLMDTFYREWLAGRSKQAAFKAAQAAVRAEYPAPFYWAAFVMMD